MTQEHLKFQKSGDFLDPITCWLNRTEILAVSSSEVPKWNRLQFMKQSHFITEKRRLEPRQKINLLDETKVAQIEKNSSTARLTRAETRAGTNEIKLCHR